MKIIIDTEKDNVDSIREWCNLNSGEESNIVCKKESVDGLHISFSEIKEFASKGELLEHIKEGDKIIIPKLCVEEFEEEDFEELDLENVPVVAVSVSEKEVVFNFDEILMFHSNGDKLKNYLANQFSKGLSKSIGIDVSARLLERDEVFGDECFGYFKKRKNRIKSYRDSLDEWWLGSAYGDYSDVFCYVLFSGGTNGNGFIGECGVSPAFRVACDA